MKYLVHRETKEHCVYEGCKYGAYWRLVEADADGWIPWNGGECPLPEDVKCHWRTKSGDEWTHGINSAELNWTGGQITHYRPILAEKEEISVVKESLASESVFDRLNHAVVAAQSIPAILAEINSLLPYGYHVTKRIEPTRE